MSGRIVHLDIDGKSLAGNPLGDPVIRRTPIYLPPGYTDSSPTRYPVVYILAGYSGHGRLMVAEKTFAESVDQRIDRLIASGILPPAVFVMPDCFTRLGGSQYVDSPAVGNYGSYVVDDVVPAIDSAFKTDPKRRGVIGKSSGGYGALRLGSKRPDLFPVIAAIAPDAAFENCYLPDFADLVTALDATKGSVTEFIAQFERKMRRRVGKRDFAAMSIIAMAACYSPDPSCELGIALPVTWPSGRLKKDVWERWLEFDPVRFLAKGSGPTSLGAVRIECGLSDEYRLQLGARQIRDILVDRGIRHVFEEFDDGHMSLDWRYDIALPWLVAELCAR